MPMMGCVIQNWSGVKRKCADLRCSGREWGGRICQHIWWWAIPRHDRWRGAGRGRWAPNRPSGTGAAVCARSPPPPTTPARHLNTHSHLTSHRSLDIQCRSPSLYSRNRTVVFRSKFLPTINRSTPPETGADWMDVFNTSGSPNCCTETATWLTAKYCQK